MNIGISSACFYPELNTETTVEVCKDLGFDLMEIFLETSYEYNQEYCRGLKQICDKNGMAVYSVHAFSSSFEPFLFDKYKRRRNDMMSIFKNICKSGEILGAKCYVFHGMRKMPDAETIDYKSIAKDIDSIADIAGEIGVCLAWENVSWCQTSNPLFIYRVMQHINTKNLKFTLDLKQARKSGHDIYEYIDVMKNDIINVHINDSNNDRVCLLPGHGCTDLNAVNNHLKKFGYEGPFIIEVYRDNYGKYEELGKVNDYLKKLLI